MNKNLTHNKNHQTYTKINKIIKATKSYLLQMQSRFYK